MYLSQKCCILKDSSRESSSSGDPPPPPDIVKVGCGDVRCMDGILARNYRITWNWPAPIYPGEVVLSHDDNPFTEDFWHVKTYGSVCTHRYNTGGWTVRYVGGEPAYPGASGTLPHCTWMSDERLPVFDYAVGDDGPAVVGYPMSCNDAFPSQPIVWMTLGYMRNEPLYSGYDFFVYITSPVTRSPAYPPVTLTYVGRTVSDDGIKNDCMASMVLNIAPSPVYHNISFPSGMKYIDGGFPVLETPFSRNGAFFDGSYTLDENAVDPEDDIFFYRRNPAIPLTCTVSPA